MKQAEITDKETRRMCSLVSREKVCAKAEVMAVLVPSTWSEQIEL